MLIFALGAAGILIPLFIILFYGLGIIIIWYLVNNSRKQTKLMKQQVQLLEEIAKANNVSPDRISGIQNENR